jgi:hypothetical protein
MNIKRGAFSLAAACCGLLLLLSCSVYNKLHPDLDRVISGPATLSSEWLEIKPQEPLKPEREVQNVIIWFAVPYTARQPPALVFEDGAAITPEVQLVDAGGNIFKLRTSGGDSSGFAYTCCDGTYDRRLPKDRTYRSVRIRSDRPIQASQIVWRCYNPWDHK